MLASVGAGWSLREGCWARQPCAAGDHRRAPGRWLETCLRIQRRAQKAVASSRASINSNKTRVVPAPRRGKTRLFFLTTRSAKLVNARGSLSEQNIWKREGKRSTETEGDASPATTGAGNRGRGRWKANTPWYVFLRGAARLKRPWQASSLPLLHRSCPFPRRVAF